MLGTTEAQTPTTPGPVITTAAPKTTAAPTATKVTSAPTTAKAKITTKKPVFQTVAVTTKGMPYVSKCLNSSMGSHVLPLLKPACSMTNFTGMRRKDK